MSPAERKRRAKLRKQAKARAARRLFREFVKNKKREWDAMVDAARSDANYAHAEKRRVQAMFDALVEIVLAINPNFPVPGREHQMAPSWLQHSGHIKQAPRSKHWGVLAPSSYRDHHTITQEALTNWFSFVQWDWDEDRMKMASVFRVMIQNRENGRNAATAYALSNILMCSAVPVEMVLRDAAREASAGLIAHMRKD